MKRGEGGVTLIELAVVMAIIAIMGLFMAPAIGEWVDNYHIRQAARDIASTLNLAKMKAISRRMEYRVVFDVGNDQYRLWVNDGGWVPDPEGGVLRVPRGVNIDNTNFGADRAEFNPDGTASSGHIEIDNEKGKLYKVFVLRTGRIRIEKSQP